LKRAVGQHLATRSDFRGDQIHELGDGIDLAQALLNLHLHVLPQIPHLRCVSRFNEFFLGVARELHDSRIKGERRGDHRQREQCEPKGLRAVTIAGGEPSGSDGEANRDEYGRQERSRSCALPGDQLQSERGHGPCQQRRRPHTPAGPRNAPPMEGRSQDDHCQTDCDGVRHQQSHLHCQSRRFPGVERKVEKVEISVCDRVLEQGDVAEENGCHGEPGNDLRD
jgi:hypothetical protein